jgi:hypothetical protein
MFVPAGSAEDPEGKEGLAHLVEHLVMGGERDTHAKLERARISARGGWSGAWTTFDYTVYGEMVPREDLRRALTRQRQRLETFAPSGDALAISKRIVLNELELRQGSEAPGARAVNALRRRALRGTRYAMPIGGVPASVASLTLDDARSFFERYYRGTRPVLVVTGGLTHDAIERIAGRVFTRPETRRAPGPSPSLPEDVDDIQDPPLPVRAGTPTAARASGVFVASPGPCQRADLEAASFALCGHRSAVFQARVSTRGTGRGGCGILELETGMMFYLVFESRDDEIPAAVWRALRRQTETLWESRLHEARVSGAMAWRGHVRAWSSLPPWQRLVRIGAAQTLSGSWEERLMWDESRRRLPKRIRRTAREHLSWKRGWTTVDVLPEEGGSIEPPNAAAGSETARHEEEKEDPP